MVNNKSTEIKHMTGDNDDKNILVHESLDICLGLEVDGQVLHAVVHMNQTAPEHCTHHTHSPWEVHVLSVGVPCDHHLLLHSKHILPVLCPRQLNTGCNCNPLRYYCSRHIIDRYESVKHTTALFLPQFKNKLLS